MASQSPCSVSNGAEAPDYDMGPVLNVGTWRRGYTGGWQEIWLAKRWIELGSTLHTGQNTHLDSCILPLSPPTENPPHSLTTAYRSSSVTPSWSRGDSGGRQHGDTPWVERACACGVYTQTHTPELARWGRNRQPMGGGAVANVGWGKFGTKDGRRRGTLSSAQNHFSYVYNTSIVLFHDTAQGFDGTVLDFELADEEAVAEAIKPNTKPARPARVTDKLHPQTHGHCPHRKDRPCPPRAAPAPRRQQLPLPLLLLPLQLGVDLVLHILHSLTKYVNGHSDAVMGAVLLPPARNATAKAFAEKLRFLQNTTGAMQSPYDSWLAQRGATTLALRMKQHGANALKVARALKRNPLVLEVIYPGLGYDLAWKSLSSHAKKWIVEEHLRIEPTASVPAGGFPFSGMISFRLPSYDAAVAFFTSTHLFTLAESLGGVESLAEHHGSWH
ncbi:Cys/Met metabolism PLP-dependent enzyme-domain-containing protein [Ephemerocybe angulata]|uniref:cystathionine gamma-lyase n=1 Tax=Ephemerocybe angulata TaxID=980116 RepID=A0A8H6HKB5_9AGAR|nr:Cys/Met metabolism PLP-dependent enzyme-domain-containing protein [Tulosesus angulatus]